MYFCPNCGEKSNKNNCIQGHNIKEELKNLRTKIDNFINIINEIINILNIVKNNIEHYYYSCFINNDYKVFQNINPKNIIKYINEINQDININTKFTKIINMYNKINSYITIKYKVEKNKEKIKLFDSKFVNKNKNNCDILYNEKYYEL